MFPLKKIEPWLRHFPRLVSVLVMVLGLLIVCAWFAHWTTLIQILPGWAPMKFNTALGFILCGAGLLLLIQKNRFAVLPGGLAALIGLLTLLEYVTGRSLGLDDLFVQPYLATATAFPGRMSPLAASCFLLIGTAIFLATGERQKNWRLAAAGILAAVVATIAAVALFGYLVGIEAAYGWGAYTRMAAHTALSFFWLGLGLVVWVWQLARLVNFNFLRWLTITGSLTLMTMIALVSAVSFAQLKSSTAWQRHTYEVLVAAETILGNLTDAQRGLRGYVLTGQSAALVPYQSGTNNLPGQLAQLFALTRDNPGQQAHLKILSADLDEVIAYSRVLLAAKRTGGMDAAVMLESTGRGLAVMDKTRADLNVFTDEEKRLLAKRSGTTEADFRNITRLLLYGSLLAALLLIFANVLASREVNRRRRAEQELHQVVALQNAILNSANYAIISATTDGTVTTFNATAERWLEHPAADVVGKLTPALWYDVGEVVARAEALSRELGHAVTPGFDSFTAKARLGGVDENEWTFIRKDGSRFPVSLSVTALTDERGEITGYLGVIADLTERKRIELERAQLAAEMKSLLESTGEGIYGIDLHGCCTFLNPAAAKLIGFTPEEAAGKNMHALIHHHRPDGAAYAVATCPILISFKSGQSCRVDSEVFWRRDGASFPVEYASFPIFESGVVKGAVVSFTDITERKRAEQEIISSLREKEALLREIHHRVKNNMQVISSILQLQAGYIKDAAALEIFRDCQGRIRTMSLIHEKLYQSKGLAEIDFKEYLESLVSLLLRSQTAKGTVVRTELQIEPITLDADTAIPLGLIVNELVSNCLKHAFAGRGQGVVRVILRRQEGGQFQLVVQDDGCGFPAGFDPGKTNSLGVRLVKILSGQIKGRMDFKSEGGAEFCITFADNSDREKNGTGQV